MTSKELKIRLGLENYTQCYIQELLTSSIPVYMITINSFQPDKYIPNKLLKFNQIGDLFKVKNNTIKVSKFSDPTNIDSYSQDISENALVFVRDLCGLMLLEKRSYNFSKPISTIVDVR